MSVLRMFQMVCDGCGGISDETHSYSEDLKKDLKNCGWKINNKAFCPQCLGDDPDYWGNRGYVV